MSVKNRKKSEAKAVEERLKNTLNNASARINGALPKEISQRQAKVVLFLVAVAVASAASEWPTARQYESTIWKPLLVILLHFAITSLVAVVVSFSPAGRSLKPGAPPMADPKKGLGGIVLIALAFLLGFGLFGPGGLVTAAALTTAAILSL